MYKALGGAGERLVLSLTHSVVRVTQLRYALLTYYCVSAVFEKLSNGLQLH